MTKAHGGACNPQACMKIRPLTKTAAHCALWPGKRYMRHKRCRSLGNLGSGSKTKQALKPSGGPPYNL